MDFFRYRDGRLYAEDVPVERIAQEAGTPCYVYSEAALKGNFGLVKEAFAEADPLICYSVKANCSLAILKLLKEQGSGFDIVSGGELFRVLKIGGDPARVVYAGVGKTPSPPPLGRWRVWVSGSTRTSIRKHIGKRPRVRRKTSSASILRRPRG